MWVINPVQNFQNKQNLFFFFFLKIFTRKAAPALNFNKQLEVKSGFLNYVTRQLSLKSITESE